MPAIFPQPRVNHAPATAAQIAKMRVVIGAYCRMQNFSMQTTRWFVKAFNWSPQQFYYLTRKDPNAIWFALKKAGVPHKECQKRTNELCAAFKVIDRLESQQGGSPLEI
ncbi:hypothetical protein C8034_v010860 [Colletotrichum sidae]|nr:hypothetical protein C8034_v010860 [Colletotrichum sidae]